MLILRRKDGEAIDIYAGEDHITVRIWQDGRKFRVGIEAPEHVKILREELEPLEVPA